MTNTKQTTKKCYCCGEPGNINLPGKNVCLDCLTECENIRYDRIADGVKDKSRLSLLGIAAELMREKAQGVKVLKVYDMPVPLLDKLKAKAAAKGITLRELVQDIFTAWCAEVHQHIEGEK